MVQIKININSQVLDRQLSGPYSISTQWDTIKQRSAYVSIGIIN